MAQSAFFPLRGNKLRRRYGDVRNRPPPISLTTGSIGGAGPRSTTMSYGRTPSCAVVPPPGLVSVATRSQRNTHRRRCLRKRQGDKLSCAVFMIDLQLRGLGAAVRRLEKKNLSAEAASKIGSNEQVYSRSALLDARVACIKVEDEDVEPTRSPYGMQRRLALRGSLRPRLEQCRAAMWSRMTF